MMTSGVGFTIGGLVKGLYALGPKPETRLKFLKGVQAKSVKYPLTKESNCTENPEINHRIFLNSGVLVRSGLPLKSYCHGRLLACASLNKSNRFVMAAGAWGGFQIRLHTRRKACMALSLSWQKPLLTQKLDSVHYTFFFRGWHLSWRL